MINEKLLKDLIRTAFWLSIVLIICVVLSCGARVHWRLDLLSHFQLQYAVGALLLSLFFAFARRWQLAVAMAVVLAFVCVELFTFAGFPRPKDTGQSFTVALYNRNVGPQEQNELRDWLSQNSARYDFVVIQEANESIATMGRELRAHYPHQIHEPRAHAFGMVVLSRHPFINVKRYPFPGQIFDNFSLRLLLQPPGFEKPVAVHALHALPPMSEKYWQQRNKELYTVASRVAQDGHVHRVMMGDWNITPYSPFFADVLRGSGLQKPVGFPAPLPTWPAFALPWLMQIPIDHILISRDLDIGAMERRRPANSDHFALVAIIHEKNGK